MRIHYHVKEQNDHTKCLTFNNIYNNLSYFGILQKYIRQNGAFTFVFSKIENVAELELSFLLDFMAQTERPRKIVKCFYCFQMEMVGALILLAIKTKLAATSSFTFPPSSLEDQLCLENLKWHPVIRKGRRNKETMTFTLTANDWRHLPSFCTSASTLSRKRPSPNLGKPSRQKNHL